MPLLDNHTEASWWRLMSIAQGLTCLRPLGLASILLAAAGSAAAGETFSATAQSVCMQAAGGALRQVRSPDGQSLIQEHLDKEGNPWFSIVGPRGQVRTVETGEWTCPEFGWAPDSSRVFATYSTGGGIGTFAVSAYRVSDEAIEAIDLVREVRRDAARHYPRCFEPEQPNIGAVAWSRDARSLLVAAQVLPHSNCDSAGTFTLYEVDAGSGKIRRRYRQPEAKKLFGAMLGPYLQTADDSCVLRPGACQIPQLHEPLIRKKAARAKSP
jgi:hypothetical protein